VSDHQQTERLSNLWHLIAGTTDDRRDAIRMACVLEATAPKVGNVHPAAKFADLTYSDFVLAANATADALGQLDCVADVDSAIATAVSASVAATRTNVNLGIVLLLAPLVAAEPSWGVDTSQTFEQKISRWQSSVELLLGQLTHAQGATIATAISASGAGGLSDESLGSDHPLDVTGPATTSYDLIAAMRLAAERDRIARQYATGFRDLFENVVPTLRDAVDRSGDLLSGIVLAHITLIAESGDSLIARKRGEAESARVANLAKTCLSEIKVPFNAASVQCIEQLDAALRIDGNRLNPGTSADLIAAAIYVMLRLIGVAELVKSFVRS
jgi:triphosphoribosyl-dephospho-CoA synthase